MPTKLGSNNIDLKIGNQTVDKMFLGSTQVYEHQTPPPTVEGRLKLTFLESGTFSFTCDDESEHEGIDLNYKLNNGAETSIGFDEEISVNSGDVVELFGDNDTFSTENSGIILQVSCQFNISGDIRSLLSKNNFESITEIPNNAFWYMLSSQPVVSAEDLILGGDTIGISSYEGFFQECFSLTTSPKELPAETIAYGCYDWLFYHCFSLITAPDIKAINISSNGQGMWGMFDGCSSLTQLPIIRATIVPENCCRVMFYGCSQIKISTTPSAIYRYAYHIPNGTSSSFNNMFAATGGTFTGTPNPNTTYYTSNEIVGDE